MERNKKNVIAFYDAALNKKDFEAAKKYFGAGYKQNRTRRRRAGGLSLHRLYQGQVPQQQERDQARVRRRQLRDRARARGARARHARLRDHRHFPARREGQDRRALGRGAAIPEKAANENGMF
jgi:hypothetical protein